MRDYVADRFGATVELVEAGGGIFDIELDGRLVFSKKAAGRFPDEDDLAALGR